MLYALKATLNSRGIATKADKIADHVRRHLSYRGFFSDQLSFGAITTFAPLGNWQQYDGQEVEMFLRDTWASGIVWASNAYLDLVVGTVGELFANAIQHGEHEMGVFCCGQLYPAREELQLVVLDLGKTIPATVAVESGLHPEREAAEAMSWAFTKGNSRFPNERGTGLAVLEDFVQSNGGGLEIYSGFGAISLDGGKTHREVLPVRFPGTLVDISVRTNRTVIPSTAWEF